MPRTPFLYLLPLYFPPPTPLSLHFLLWPPRVYRSRVLAAACVTGGTEKFRLGAAGSQVVRAPVHLLSPSPLSPFYFTGRFPCCSLPSSSSSRRALSSHAPFPARSLCLFLSFPAKLTAEQPPEQLSFTRVQTALTGTTQVTVVSQLTRTRHVVIQQAHTHTHTHTCIHTHTPCVVLVYTGCPVSFYEWLACFAGRPRAEG